MAFRYINPGYVSLLDSNVTANEVTDTEHSKTGVGFTQTNTSGGITLPNFIDGDDFWMAFNAYLPNSYVSIWCLFISSVTSYNYGIYLVSNNRANVYNNEASARRYSTSYTMSYARNDNWDIHLEGINSFVCHVHFGDANDSLIELWINGTKFSKTGLNLTYTDVTTKKALLYSTGTGANDVIFSNIIISDTEISPKEQVIALPTLATETNMTAGESGLFIANTANQTLLQSVDASELIESYGASSTVTGIALVGNPAYKTATGLTSLIGLSKGGASIVEHDTCDLSDETDAVIVDGWTTENMTIADLRDMQFGWKAGE